MPPLLPGDRGTRGQPKVLIMQPDKSVPPGEAGTHGLSRAPTIQSDPSVPSAAPGNKGTQGQLKAPTMQSERSVPQVVPGTPDQARTPTMQFDPSVPSVALGATGQPGTAVQPEPLPPPALPGKCPDTAPGGSLQDAPVQANDTSVQLDAGPGLPCVPIKTLDKSVPPSTGGGVATAAQPPPERPSFSRKGSLSSSLRGDDEVPEGQASVVGSNADPAGAADHLVRPDRKSVV